jgi:hypothetical protein
MLFTKVWHSEPRLSTFSRRHALTAKPCESAQYFLMSAPQAFVSLARRSSRLGVPRGSAVALAADATLATF